MHKTILFFGLLLGLMLAGLGCGKEDKPTIIKGRITDRKTGEPIEGAAITFGVVNTIKGLDKYTTQFCGLSDANGAFNCTLEGRYSISEIRKGGYIVHEKNLPIVEGQENNLDIKMVPRDGFLRLNIKNDMGQHDTIYAYIYSLIGDIEGSGSEGSLKTYPVILQTGDTYMEILQLASPETVAVRWGFNKLNYYQVDFAFQDSILVVPNDTTTYILSY